MPIWASHDTGGFFVGTLDMGLRIQYVDEMSSQSELSNVEVLVLVVHDLGGQERPVDTEDVAVRAREVAPQRFSLLKYPDQVDIERVRKRLSDAKKADQGGMLAGSFKHGWHLTPAGLDWAEQSAHMLKSPDSSLDRTSTDQQTARKLRVETARLVALDAWAKYSTGDPVSTREAEAVFRLTPYVAQVRREQIIDSTRNLFRHDEQLGPFVEAMAAVIKQAGGEL